MVAVASLLVDGHAPETDLQAAIKSACRELLGWRLPDEQISISFISGGITNPLFKVAPTAPVGAGAGNSASPLPSPVAFRIYGDNTERFIDRTKELAVMELVHKHGFGPKVVGQHL